MSKSVSEPRIAVAQDACAGIQFGNYFFDSFTIGLLVIVAALWRGLRDVFGSSTPTINLYTWLTDGYAKYHEYDLTSRIFLVAPSNLNIVMV